MTAIAFIKFTTKLGVAFPECPPHLSHRNEQRLIPFGRLRVGLGEGILHLCIGAKAPCILLITITPAPGLVVGSFGPTFGDHLVEAL